MCMLRDVFRYGGLLHEPFSLKFSFKNGLTNNGWNARSHSTEALALREANEALTKRLEAKKKIDTCTAFRITTVQETHDLLGQKAVGKQEDGEYNDKVVDKVWCWGVCGRPGHTSPMQGDCRIALFTCFLFRYCYCRVYGCVIVDGLGRRVRRGAPAYYARYRIVNANVPCVLSS